MSVELNIKKHLPDFALDVSLSVSGGCLGILGPSGCGKSMTLKSIAGIINPDSGYIQVNGIDLYRNKKSVPSRKRKVGYLFQDYAIFPNMTVYENIKIAIEGNKRADDIVRAQIKRFHLDGLENRYKDQLSGGQLQRVALARIFAYEPDVLLLDEPFAALDSYLRDELILELAEVIREYQKDTIIVSHSRDEIYSLCDDVLVMNNGKKVISGPVKDVFNNPQYMQAAVLTGCKNISEAKKISDRRVFASEWNIEIDTADIVPDDISYVGIRAHMVNAVSSKNIYEASSVKYIENAFEYEYCYHMAGAARDIIYRMPKGVDRALLQGNTFSIPEQSVLILR